MNLDVVAVTHLADAIASRRTADPLLIEQLLLADLLPDWRDWYERREAA